MGQALAVRSDFTSKAVRRLAQRARNAAQARRLLAIAAVLDGASREEAAKAGGMDRQTLRDWVIGFNEEGPEGLTNKPSPGAPGKLNDKHKAFLARIVDEGPIPAIHGVVRQRGRGPTSKAPMRSRRSKKLCHPRGGNPPHARSGYTDRGVVWSAPPELDSFTRRF